MSRMLSGLQGVACMMDDVLVFGQTKGEHDQSLGAVLERIKLTQQQEDQQWKPVANASRALTPTKERCAQIEKDAFGITWACERFSPWLLAR